MNKYAASAQHFIHPIGPDTPPMEVMVVGWFSAGFEVVWIPIFEVKDFNGAVQALADAQAGRIDAIRLHTLADFIRIPEGIKGWVIPAHLEDTEVVATRYGGEVTFGALRHPHTGEVISYRYDTEAELLGRGPVSTN